MRNYLIGLVLLAGVGGSAFSLLTAPSTIASLPAHTPDLANGERMFWAGGCGSCHGAASERRCDRPREKEGEDKETYKKRLAGGRCLKTPFGTFYAPNISPDRETGIGTWTAKDFVNALKRGVAPDGRHYYPAFPYTSYRLMRTEDVLDLFAYLKTLPPIRARAPAHELALPLRWRRGLGLWKLLFFEEDGFRPRPDRSALEEHGRYLVDGPGHCGECHTPRNLLGGFIKSQYLAGGPSPDGKGWVPNITQHPKGLANWSAKDIAYALETGLTPSFDSFGGAMVEVQENLAKLPAADRAAIAAYLKSLPAIAGPERPRR